jgi:hypothetical protein
MKPSRKLSRRSFVTLVSGGNPSGFGAPGGQSKPDNDHDLAHQAGAGGGGADPDRGPESGSPDQ